MPRKKAAPPQSQSAIMSPLLQEIHAKPYESYMMRRQQDPSLPVAIVVQTQLFHQRQGEGKSVAESDILESLEQSHLSGVPMHFRDISEPFKLCPDEAILKSILENSNGKEA